MTPAAAEVPIRTPPWRTSNTRYVYRIKARNTAGLSGESTFVNITTLASPSVERDSTRDGAFDLGDITTTLTPGFASRTVADSGDAIDYYRFTLTEPMRVVLGLRQQDANADLFLENAEGEILKESRETGKTNEAISKGLPAGTYYIRVHAQESRRNDYKLRYGVSTVTMENEADGSWDTPQIQDLPGWEVAGDRMLVGDGSRLSDQQLASVTHTLNGLETHNINHAGDVDWFKLNLDADSLYVFKMNGRGVGNMTGLTLEYPTIFAVYNSDAQHYPYTYDLGGGGDHNAMLLFHSQYTLGSQVYYLAVSGTGQQTGTYSIMIVKMEDGQNWTFGHELGTRGSITVDAAPQEAEIAFEGDVDFWEFEGTAEQEYIVSIRPIGTYRDRNRISPVLRGLYYDDPRYKSHPGLRNNAGTTLEDFEVRGRVISGRALSVANADGDAPFADSFSDIMHDLSPSDSIPVHSQPNRHLFLRSSHSKRGACPHGQL